MQSAIPATNSPDGQMPSGSDAPPARHYKRHSALQWEEHKAHIRKLYIDESRTLDEVVQIMRLQHDFLARYLAVSSRGLR
jgi:Clr5 domain